MHDRPFLESQLMAHVEPMMEEDEQTTLGSAIDEEWTNVQTANRVVVCAITCRQEVLELDRVVL